MCKEESKVEKIIRMDLPLGRTHTHLPLRDIPVYKHSLTLFCIIKLLNDSVCLKMPVLLLISQILYFSRAVSY